MKKLLILIAALAIAAPAFGAAGIDLAANHICPGAAGASGDGGVLDCVLLANTGKFVSIYSSLFPAENISDLSNLDGQVNVDIVGSWDTNGAFYDGSPGACLETSGAAPPVTFTGAKPSNGDPCGSSLTIRQCFQAGSGLTTVKNTSSDMSMFFTVYNAGPLSVTTANRLFGFEIRYDPAFATENGGATCGTCSTPVCWTIIKATPGSLGGSPTTTLTTSTGTVGVDTHAFYNAGCAAVPTKARTWGQLKSLYR